MVGVVPEATLRLIQLPPVRASLSVSFGTIEGAAIAVQEILQSGCLASALEIADRFTLEAAREHLAKQIVPQGDAHLLIDLDGQEQSVRSELEALIAQARSLGALTVESAFGEMECEQLWDLRRGFSESLKATGLTKLNQDVTVPRGRIVDLVRFAVQLQHRFGFHVACFRRRGVGIVHVTI